MKKKQRYIVVDDDVTSNMICEFMIKRLDREADIKMFAVPEEGLTFLKTEFSSRSKSETLSTVLFLDVNMPSMTGWEFLDEFLQFNEWVKVPFTIYILSSSIEDFTKEAKIYPFIQGFLSKPLNITNLERIWEELQELQIN